MGYPPPQPPQGGGSYQQYLPPGQQPGQQPQQGYPAPPQPGPAYGPYNQPQPQQGYPAPQAGYGPPPTNFLEAFGQADLSAGGPPVPAGSYPGVIAEPAEFGTTSAGDKSVWVVRLKIDGGEYGGKTLTKRVVISPDSPKSMGMMYRQVSALTGLPMPDPENPAAPQNAHWQQGGEYLATLMRPGTPVDLEVSYKPRNDDPSRMTNDIEMVHPRGARTGGQPQQQPGPAAMPAQPPAQPQPVQQAMPYPPQQQAYPSQPGPTPGYGAAPAGTGSTPAAGPSAAGPPPSPQQYGQQQAAQPHPGGTAEFAPPQGIGQQAGQNGQPPAQPQQPGTLPAPPWQQG